MNKQVKIISATSLATVAILATNSVSAEENTQVTETAANTQVNSTTAVVVPTNQAEAINQVDKMSTKVNAAQTAADEATANQTTLQNQVTAVNQDLSAEQNQNVQLASDISTEQQNISNLSEQVANNDAAVTTAQANYDKVAAENPTAAQDIQLAQDAVATKTAAETAANQKVSDAQTAVDTANTELDAAKATALKQQQDVKNAETKVATKTTDVDAARTALNSAETKDAALKSEVTAKTAELQDAVNNTGTSITETKSEVVATSNFTDLIKYFNDNSDKHEPLTLSGSETIDIELTKAQKEELARTGEFTYTPNNEEITKWVVTYVNELRRLNGISERVTASSEALKIAVARAAEMERNNRLSHASDLPYESENIGAGMLDTTAEKGDVEKGMRPLILSDQAMAYFMVYGWFDDATSGGYGHRNSLLFDNGEIGVAVDLNETKSHGYFAYDLINLDRNKDFGYMVKTYNYDEVKDANGQLNTTINGKKPVFLPDYTFNMVNTTTTVKANPSKAAAQKALDDYKTSSAKQLDASAAKVQAAKTALANAQTELTAAKAELATAKDNVDPTLVSTAEQKVTDAGASLLAAKADLQKAVSEKQDAQNNLELISAKYSSLSDALTALNTAKKAAEDASTNLENAKKRLLSLTAKKVTSDGKLSELRAQLATLRSDYELAKKQKVSADFELKLAKDNLVLAKSYLGMFGEDVVVNPILTPSKLDSVKVLPNHGQKKNPTLLTVSSDKARIHGLISRVNDEKKYLPETGSKENNVFLLAGMSILSLLGLGHVRKDKRRF